LGLATLPAYGYTVSWSSSNTSIAQVTGYPTATSATILGSGTGSAVITATINPTATACFNSYSVTTTVTTGQEFNGAEPITDNSGQPSNWICIGNSFTASAPIFNGTTTYTWSCSSNLQITSGAGTSSVTVQALSAGGASLSVAINTYCGSETITKTYIIGSQFDASKDPFDGVTYNCTTKTFNVTAPAFQSTTNYYWTLTEYSITPALLGVTNTTTTSNVSTFVLKPKTDHGSLCLKIDVGGCGISDQRCYNFSAPCRQRVAFGGGDSTIVVNNDNKQTSVYPNPATDEVVVDLSSLAKYNPTIGIYDAQGKKVMNVVVAANQITVTANVRKLNSGLYYVKIDSQQGTTTLKFVKQ
jgi:hypothetical protein